MYRRELQQNDHAYNFHASRHHWGSIRALLETPLEHYKQDCTERYIKGFPFYQEASASQTAADDKSSSLVCFVKTRSDLRSENEISVSFQIEKNMIVLTIYTIQYNFIET